MQVCRPAKLKCFPQYCEDESEVTYSIKYSYIKHSRKISHYAKIPLLFSHVSDQPVKWIVA